MRKTLLAILASIVVLIVSLGLMMFRVGSEDNADELVARYNNTTETVKRPISVQEVIRKIKEEEDGGAGGAGNGMSGTGEVPMPVMPGHGGTLTADDWLSILDAVHKEWGAAGLYYEQDWHTYMKSDGSSAYVRTDCSGYVSYALQVMGIFNSSTAPSSKEFDDVLRKAGFTQIDPSDVQSGDILVWYKDHVEVMADLSNGRRYNWGSSGSAENKYTDVLAGTMDINDVDSTVSGSRDYTTCSGIWRLPQQYLSSSSENNEEHVNTNIPQIRRDPDYAGLDFTKVSAPGKDSSKRAMVLVDPGHNCRYTASGTNSPVSKKGPYGWATSGTGGEQEFTSDMANRIAQKLIDEGFQVCRVEDFSYDGTQCTVSEWGNEGRRDLFRCSEADLMIQIHYDGIASIDPIYHGGHVIYYDVAYRGVASSIAGRMAQTSVGITPANQNANGDGTRLSTRELIRTSEKPLLLIECGFGNTSENNYPGADRFALQESSVRDEIASAIVMGVDDYYK